MKYNIDKAIEILSQTPKTLNSFLGDLSEDWIYCNEGPNTWSAFDIIGHLIYGDQTDWMTRLHIILGDSEQKTFTTFDRFAQIKLSKGKTLNELLHEFEDLRTKNLKELKDLNLTHDQLQLKGVHPELGEVNLSQLLASWVTHDLGHIAQISRVMAKQYKTEVGPWAAYISIINK